MAPPTGRKLWALGLDDGRLDNLSIHHASVRLGAARNQLPDWTGMGGGAGRGGGGERKGQRWGKGEER